MENDDLIVRRVLATQRAIADGKAEPEPVEKAWRSFRALPRREHAWLRVRPPRGAAERA
jgi:hypothetical protein